MEKQRPKKKYKTYVVSFIDILGFRKLISGESSADRIFEIQDRFQKSMSTYHDKAESKTLGLDTVYMSDSIIKICDLTKNPIESPLFWEISEIGFAQGELLIIGKTLVRGALTCGLLLNQNQGKNIFGPALIKAYEMEGKDAIFPRIIIDGKTLSDIKTEPRLVSDRHNPNQELEYVTSLLRLDEDGKWFIDYLKILFEDHYNREYILRKHKEAIEELISRLTDEDVKSNRLVIKYGWLINYHNKFCAEMGLEENAISKNKLMNIENYIYAS